MPEEGEKFRTVDQYWFVIFFIIFAKFTTTRKKRRLSAGVSLPKKEGKESVVVRRLGNETQNYWFYRLIMG